MTAVSVTTDGLVSFRKGGRGMKKRLFSVLAFFAVVVLQVLLSGAFTYNAEAAAKPAVAKKKVTMYTDSGKYTIELKNVKDNAKITYSSSDKSVVTVKKGVVTAVGEGKATVKVKVKQNKKTYKLKITFTVKKASKSDNDSNSGNNNGKSDADTDYSADAVKKSTENSLFGNERSINNALDSGNTDKLSKDEKALYDKVKKLAKELKGKKEYDTVKNIHDYLVNNIVYPSSWSGTGVHTLNYALNEGVCVCDGYAKAFYFLCKANGIEAFIVGGTASDDRGSESHAWNKVKIDGKWYTIDVTWDDPRSASGETLTYDYFLVTDKDISRSHTWDDTGLPDAYSEDLGIVYVTYKDTKKIEKQEEATEYFKKQAKEFLDKKERGSKLELDFLVISGNEDYMYSLIDIVQSYYASYRCGYSYNFESAGFYGILCQIKLNY